MVNFKINMQPMGSIFSSGGIPHIAFYASDSDGEHASSITLYYGITGDTVSTYTFTTVYNTDTLIINSDSIPNLSTHYYWAVVTQEDGDVMTSSPKWYTRNDTMILVGLDENTAPAQAQVFPNPASEYFMVSASLPISEIQLFSTTGMLLEDRRYDGRSYDTSFALTGISNGIYIAHIRTTTGMFTKKIVVQK